MKLNDSTVSMTAQRERAPCGGVEEIERESLSIEPQLAVGGGTPRPRKLIVASLKRRPFRLPPAQSQLNDVRQNMPRDDAPIACHPPPRGLYIFAFTGTRTWPR